MISPEQAEYELLKLATGEPATFSLYVYHRPSPEVQAAFERAVAGEWIRLIDVTSNGSSDAREIKKVFRLTDKGWYRRNVLESFQWVKK